MPVSPSLRCFATALLSMGAALAGVMTASPAQAFWNSAAGPRVCAPHAHRFDVPGLWLGHFSGGRKAFHANGDLRVDWANEYRCFFSARACLAWRAGMKREFRRYEGHGTCIALRGGGARVAFRRHAIPARY